MFEALEDMNNADHPEEPRGSLALGWDVSPTLLSALNSSTYLRGN